MTCGISDGERDFITSGRGLLYLLRNVNPNFRSMSCRTDVDYKTIPKN